jgi:CubicO group peptidase (beta-lactamase class C family)
MAHHKFKPFHQLVSELLWSKLGVEKHAYISVDANGTGAFDGGICATLRDLARFGAMICRNGESLPDTPGGSG